MQSSNFRSDRTYLRLVTWVTAGEVYCAQLKKSNELGDRQSSWYEDKQASKQAVAVVLLAMAQKGEINNRLLMDGSTSILRAT